jgi:hypothetical protein
MKLRDRLQHAKQRLHKFIFRLPVGFGDDVLEFAEAVIKARQDGFTDQEVDVLLAELGRLAQELKTIRQEVPK